MFGTGFVNPWKLGRAMYQQKIDEINMFMLMKDGLSSREALEKVKERYNALTPEQKKYSLLATAILGHVQS